MVRATIAEAKAAKAVVLLSVKAAVAVGAVRVKSVPHPWSTVRK